MRVNFANLTRYLPRPLGVSTAALLLGLAATPSNASTLPAAYSPGRDNGGGANPGRVDIITIASGSDSITGSYALIGTSAPRFVFVQPTLAQRQASGQVVSGYAAIDGQVSVALTTEQKTQVVAYPDAARGAAVAINVYDNAKLTAVASTAQSTRVYRDNRTPVYGDLRIANIAGATVTIATGDKTRSVYDQRNLAVLAADSGSTLYDVTGGSAITYDARTATMSGRDQEGLSQPAQQTVRAPVTTFSGIAFGNGDHVTDLDSLKRYNSALIGQLTAGQITPAQYDMLIHAAATSSTKAVVVSQNAIAAYRPPATTSSRTFMRLDGSTLTTTAGSALIGTSGIGGRDGGSTLIRAANGSTITNNGQIVTAEEGPGIVLAGAGTSLTNAVTGVLGVGYETLDRTGGAPVPTGAHQATDNYGYNNSAALASDGASVVNRGIVNVSNRDIPGQSTMPTVGKADQGIVVGSGATASNQGTILIGGAASAAANTPGSYSGAAGLVANPGGTATNAANGTIRIGSTFAETAADLAAIGDVLSVNAANGMVATASGGTLVNDGIIRIGGLAQNAAGILVGGGSTATNAGTIAIAVTAATTPTQSNAAISVLGHSGNSMLVDATNAAAGRIQIDGVNAVGLLVRSTVPGGSARAVNLGTITLNGGLSADRLPGYAVLVDGAAASVSQNGVVALNGQGAIGVQARNGGTIDVGAKAKLSFGGANEIGYDLLGAGSRITFAGTTPQTVVSTVGSTGIRVEGGATLTGNGVALSVTGGHAIGIVATGASVGTTLDTTRATIAVSGDGAVGAIVAGGATGTIGATIGLNGDNTIAAIVDGRAVALDGSPAGPAIASTKLTSSAELSSNKSGLTGYLVRNKAQLVHSGTISLPFADTSILATTGASVVNSGSIAVGRGGVGIHLLSTGAGDIVTDSDTGTTSFTGGDIYDRGRGIQADGAGATATLGAGAAILLDTEAAIGVEAVNGGTIDARAIGTPVFADTDTQQNQIAYRIVGAGSRVLTRAGTAGAIGYYSTLFRLDDGAARTFDNKLALFSSGYVSTAVVASGAGTSVRTVGTAITVSGFGIGLMFAGGSTGTLDAATTITLEGDTGVRGVAIDGRISSLKGEPSALEGPPTDPILGATVNSAATVTGAASITVAYVLRNGATLNHSGKIALSGDSLEGVSLSDAGTTLVNSGSIVLTGSGGTGIMADDDAVVVNNGTVQVADGLGIDLGFGSSLTGNGSIALKNGEAALNLFLGATADISGTITAGGTAHAVQVGFFAGDLTLGTGKVTVNGSGNGIDNSAGSLVRLNGTPIVVNGTGSGIRTAVDLDPASVATITAAGPGSTAYTFSAQDNPTTSGDATLFAGLTLTASGAGATGLRLETTGSASIAAKIGVTSAAGGAAVIGGPAASIVNTGTLRSSSTVAPVVDLTGGTGAFTSSGTIAASSATAVAVQGGNNGQSVTITGGTVNGVIQLGGGNDTFLMSAGTFDGSLDTGAGNDQATFRNLTDDNLSAVSAIAGSGVKGGSDTLTFDHSQTFGTKRITGWNTVALINGSTLSADGDLRLADGGRLTIDKGSTFYASAYYANSVFYENPHSPINVTGSIVNAGTIDLTNATGEAGDTLLVLGNYAGNGGVLKLDTVLNATGPSDVLAISGGTVTGTTTIVVANAGGLGARTTDNGILVVAGFNGAITTATTTRTGFVLAGGHVDAGAFQYRLFASDGSGSQNWYLRSDAAASPSAQSEHQAGAAAVAYRPEVALLTGLPQQLRQQDLDMVGTYHQRMGARTSVVVDGSLVPGRLWGRQISDRDRNTLPSSHDRQSYGYQLGAALFRFGAGSGSNEIGVYSSVIGARAGVRGSAGGLLDQYVGRTDLKTTYAGAYWTDLADDGLYIDAVVQRAWYNGHADSAAGNQIDVKGFGMLGSVETGYAIPLSARFTVEPQAQLVAQDLKLADVRIPNAGLVQHGTATLTARLGARLVGTVLMGETRAKPYLLANLWKQFGSADRATFSGGVGDTVFNTRTSSRYGQTGAGFTVPLRTNMTAYGEGDYSFMLDHRQAATEHAVSGSVGMKMQF